MSTFVTTIILATILVILCALGMGIGKLLTGKSKFSCKRCGDPTKTENKKGCSVCSKKPKDPQDDSEAK